MAPKKDAKDATPPPGQKSLTSFFGAARSKKTGEAIPPKKVQTGIKSGLKKQAAHNDKEEEGDNKADETKKAVKQEEGKENVENGDEKPAAAAVKKEEEASTDDLMDTDDEAEAGSSDKKPVAKVEGAKKASRKRVIQEDSDSEEEDEKDAKAEAEAEDDEDYDNGEDEEEDEELEDEQMDEESDDDTVDISDAEEEEAPQKAGSKSAKGKSAEKKSSPKKKQKTLTGKPAPKPKSKSTGSKKSEAVAAAMKSNSQLLRIMADETIADGDAKTWEEGKATPYSALCDAFSDMDAISGRLEIQEHLTTLFRKVLLCDGGGKDDNEDEGGDSGKEKKKGDDAARSDLYTLIYLADNSVAPKHANVELGVGDSILIKAIGEASGTAPAMIKQKYAKEGDLGTVAETCKGKQRTLVGFGRVSGPKRLSCQDVLKVFKEIANTSGSQSQKWKVDKIKSLLVRAKGSESKYIIRGLQGKLRIGVSQSTVLVGLAHAVALTRPKGVVELDEGKLEEIRALDGKEGAYPDFARKLCTGKRLPLDVRLEAVVGIVKKAYHEVPSYDALLDAVLHVPLQEVHKSCTLTPGIPVVPMLAKPTKSVGEVLKRLNGLRFTCEYKYDGERAQVHMTPDGKLSVFSRNLLNTSEKFPEAAVYVKEACKDTNVTSFVLDTEVVAWNRETKQFVPFQILSTRKRTEESAESAKVTVIVQAFDLMYLNGKRLLDKTLAERRELMKKNFLPVDGKFQYATALDHTENGDTAIIEEFLDAAIKGQCEGLMVKTLDVNAVYEPDRRSLNWLKLKKDYLEGLGDSVDLVPLGAYHGKGKRTGVYGAYLLACYDEDTEEFQSVCKIGTGFSEEDLKDLAASLNEHIIPEKSSQYNVSDTLECDVWFDAVQVWEVKAADLSKSSTHKGAVDKTGEAGRGIGLRFPRYERQRPDKKPEQATSSDQILDMYYAQDSIVDGGGGGGMDMDGI
ncbi:hypothetical protein ACHAXT_009643 [Thalassiosira profunda]